MTFPTTGFEKPAPKPRAWTGVDALVVAGFVIAGALLLWGRGAFINRLVMGEDEPLPTHVLLPLLSGTAALFPLAGLCAALTVQKPLAAFVGYVMSVMLGYAFSGVVGPRAVVGVVIIGAVIEAVFFGCKYARFDFLSGSLAGFAAVVVSGLVGIIAGGFDVEHLATQFGWMLIRLLVTLVVVVPLAYVIAKAVRAVLRRHVHGWESDTPPKIKSV